MTKESSKTFLIIAFSVLACILIFMAGGFAFYFFQDKILQKEEPTATVAPEKKTVEEPEANDEEDEIELAPVISAPPVVEREEAPAEPAKSDLQLIKEALASKHGKDVSQVIAEITKREGNYVMGGVRFTGAISGAWFLAYKDGGNWIITADGNGTIPCSAVDPYGFPASIAPECWDDSTSTLITR